MPLTKIVSGGQTGVDRGALDAALTAGFPCGGWAPGDRMAEDGIIPERYPLIVLPQGGYRQRTRLNVVDSDGTAIIYCETLKGGTRLTRNLCALLKRPYVLIDARRVSEAEAVGAVLKFVEGDGIQTLNVAGPRESGWPLGYAYTLAVIGEVIARCQAGTNVKPTVSTSDYRQGILDAYIGEFQGIALFTELVTLVGTDVEKRAKLANLVNPERRTAEELSPLVLRYGLGSIDRAAAEAAGRAWAVRAESWDGMIQMLLADLPAYVATYDALLDAAPTADRSILTFLAAHERALLRFAKIEAEGQSGDSLIDVQRLFHPRA